MLGLNGTLAYQTLEQFVARKLREAILLGHLRPGDKLDQNEIAETLGVSRSPVRDALRTLSAEGLVEVYPHRGAVVAELSADELEEIFLIRRILEGIAARLAVQSLNADQIVELRQILDEIDRTNDLDSWLELNRRFHHTLYQAAGRPRLLSMVENLRNTTVPYVRQFIATSKHKETSQASHRRILKACEDRNGTLAEQETQMHMNDVCLGVLKHITKLQSVTPADSPVSFPVTGSVCGV